MKVLIVGNYEPTGQESMQRFADLLYAGMQRRGVTCELLRPRVLLGQVLPGPMRKWLGYADSLVVFRRELHARLQGIDLVHICDHSNGIYVPWVGGLPTIVTCHDLIAVGGALEGHSEHKVRWSGRLLQRWTLSGLKRATHIACVSENTRQELLRLSGIGAGRVSVVHNGLNYRYEPMPGAEARERVVGLGLGGLQRFLLHVGGNQWYKNRVGVVRIFRALLDKGVEGDLHLVLAGKAWPRKLQSEVHASGVASRIHSLVGVGNEDLRALYSLAEGLLFPSLVEGFGWPLIEAQACGCPVFASERAPMPEVVGDGGVFFDPSDAVSAAEKVGQGLADRERLRILGFANVGRFRTERMLDNYEEAYRSCLNGGSAREGI